MLGRIQIDQPLRGRTIDQIQINIIAMTGPVDHVLAVGQLPIGHHFLGIHIGLNARFIRVIIGTRTIEFAGIVVFRTNDGAIGLRAIVLQDHGIGKILNDVIRSRNVHIFTGERTRFHTHIKRNAR